MGADDMLAVYEVNVLGVVRVTRAMLPLLKRSRVPVIVNVSSGLASLSRAAEASPEESEFTLLSYSSSKAALNMLTVRYAKALPQFRVNAVDPGNTATDLNEHRGPKTVAQGARIIVAMATIGPDGPTGTFVRDEGAAAW